MPYVPITGTSFSRNIVGKLAPLLQFVFSLAVTSIFRQKEFRIALAPNQNFKGKLDYPSVFLKGWKRFATLLPNNWLAETPQTLASRRLGRQSAERERISEINWNDLLKKLQASLITNMFKTSLSFKFFSVILIGMKRCATLLPNNWVAETPQAHALMRLGRQAVEKERVSEINWNVFLKKLQASLDYV
ncbi:hypothetical protein IFR10_03935 [Bacillus sp. CFBP 13597]|nr:hypothetical protein [Bacillus sp. CFBP 13597]